MTENSWPYKLALEDEIRMETDVLVLGGGIAGCMAAIRAAKLGKRVILVEKGDPKRSGAGGSGCDHWESAATNPCSKVTPEALTEAMLDDNDGFNNGISHYIECLEGYDRLLELEHMGAKIRDTDNEFLGADFRDEETKLLFAYDYKNRFTLRIWGTTFKPAMVKEMKRLGVTIVSRVMATALLTEGGLPGYPCIGATGVDTRSGAFYVFKSKATIMCMSRPARVWLFSPGLPGLSEFRPPQCVGDGHGMGYRIGAAFTMMEKSVGAQFSAAGRSFPPYGAGNNHNTWYPASLIDSEGKEIPYVDRNGKRLKSFKERTVPSEGQPFFMKGGAIEEAKYPYLGPETVSFQEMMKEGYKPPFYADLTQLPPLERKVIWGMMVGEEGKTKIPILKNYQDKGFDPSRDVLQCYGTGWTSAQFMPNERQLFGLPGGFFHDWQLMTNIQGLFAAGDALFASNCYGHAAATGDYAARHACGYVTRESGKNIKLDEEQIKLEKQRIYQPLHNDPQKSMGWKELNLGISKVMQSYCGSVKDQNSLGQGLEILESYEKMVAQQCCALNPHELVRLLEVMNILTVSRLIIESSMARKASCKALDFFRSDSQDELEEAERVFILLKKIGDEILLETKPLDYFGDLKANYDRANRSGILV